ncbi:MAG: FAD-dependent oxidoreductase [Candidatus Marinimicrobia bacterium]|nr:FAD-dependent oxidoreductase [Candidatus Neomarinimicrobiota bacterium]
MSAKQLVIVGGGFAGLAALSRSAGRGLDITLIEPHEGTTMIPALPDVTGGFLAPGALHTSLKDVLPARARHLKAAALRVDVGARVVETTAGAVPYDYLLLSSGSRTAPAAAPPQPYMHYLDRLADGRRLYDAWRARLAAPAARVARAVIIGGGYTGLEVARNLAAAATRADRAAEVTVIEIASEFLGFLPPARRAWVLAQLEGAGVRLLSATKVQAYEPEGVALSSGVTLVDPLCVVCTGSRSALPEVPADWPRLSDGRLCVEPTLQVPGAPTVFAAGDAAAFPDGHGGYLRKAVNFAFYGGRCAGRNIVRHARAKPLRPFRPFDLGWVIPLHDRAVGQMLGRFWIQGGLPMRLHYFMCGYRKQGAPRRALFSRVFKLPDATGARQTKENQQ